MKQDSISNLKVTRDAAAILGAVTSATVVFALVYYPALEAFGSEIVAYILGGFSVALVLFIVDYGLRTDLAYGLDLAFSSKLGRKTRLIAFLSLFLLFNGARALVSMALSWEGRKDVAAAAIKAPELNAQLSQPRPGRVLARFALLLHPVTDGRRAKYQKHVQGPVKRIGLHWLNYRPHTPLS